MQTMGALALLMELASHRDRKKLRAGWELNPQLSGYITAALPIELQGQTGAGRGNWRCQIDGNEYVQVQRRVTFLKTLAM